MAQRIFDISPVISSRTAVFPGDKNFSREIVLDFKKGDNLLLSNIQTTAHIGAHVDAPNHYHPTGVGISKVELNRYVGLTQVIEVRSTGPQRILLTDLSTQKILAPRILLKTSSFPNPMQWNSDFKALSPELVEFFASEKVQLVGIDTPSVDLENDKELICHNLIFKKNISILEGILLTEVPEGLYILSALPLKLEDLDASLVRAVLFPLDYDFKRNSL